MKITTQTTEQHYMAHYHTRYTSDDRLSAVDLLAEMKLRFHCLSVNSIGQRIGYWSDGSQEPVSQEFYDNALSFIALYTDITPEEIRARTAQNRRQGW